jgi:hypothetical protein
MLEEELRQRDHLPNRAKGSIHHLNCNESGVDGEDLKLIYEQCDACGYP